MEAKDLERLTRVETQVEIMLGVVVGMDKKLDIFAAEKVSRSELLLQLELRDQRIAGLETRLQEIETERMAEKQTTQQDKNTIKQSWPNWVACILALGALVLSYHQNK